MHYNVSHENNISIKYKNSTLTYNLLLIQLFAVYFQYSLTGKNSSAFLKILGIFDEIMAIIFIIILLAYNRQKTYSITKIIFFPLFIIIPYIFMVSYLNNSPLSYLLAAYRAYFIYIPTFLIIYIYLDKIKIFKLLQAFGAFVIFEFLLIVIQAIRNILLGSTLILGDAISGTFSGANSFGYVISMPLLLYVTFYANRINIYNQTIDKYIIVLAFITIFLVEAKASLFAFIFIAFFIIFISKNIRKYLFRNIIYISILTFIGIGIFSLLYSNQGSFTNNNIVNVFNIAQTLKDENNVQSGSSRLLWFPLTYTQLEQFAYHPLIGMGPSTHSSYASVSLEAPIAMNHVMNAFGQKDLGMDGGVDSQIIPIWAEYGYIGIILFYTMFIYILMYFAKQHKFKSSLIKTSSLVGISLTIYMIVMSYANHVWEAQVESFTYWVLLGICLKMIKIEKENTQNE